MLVKLIMSRADSPEPSFLRFHPSKLSSGRTDSRRFRLWARQMRNEHNAEKAAAVAAKTAGRLEGMHTSGLITAGNAKGDEMVALDGNVTDAGVADGLDSGAV
jgi:hypothetical protein